MRLSYRGLPYAYEPPTIDEVETQLRGRYRGQGYALTYPRHIPVPQLAQDLQYRGIAYRMKTTGQIELLHPRYTTLDNAPAHVSAFANDAASARRLGKRALMREVARVHRENLQRRLQHRLDVAKAQGDINLIAQLEDEMHQMA